MLVSAYLPSFNITEHAVAHVVMPLAPSTACACPAGDLEAPAGSGAPAPLLCRKWFYQPKLHKRKRKHGFLKRCAAGGGVAARLPD